MPLPITLTTKLGEEVGQGVDVAVDALGQLPGPVRLVKGHVEPQNVAEQIEAQGIGRGPGHRLAHVDVDDRQDLCGGSDGEEERAVAQQRRRRGARKGLIQKSLNNLGVDQPQAGFSQRAKPPRRSSAATAGGRIGYNRDQNCFAGIFIGNLV